uniref:Uncharacterized protein n=1 Tax=Oncorhynchus mykiss TaxID=8022 RepID=A0A8L0DRP0_ONCMY
LDVEGEVLSAREGVLAGVVRVREGVLAGVVSLREGVLAGAVSVREGVLAGVVSEVDWIETVLSGAGADVDQCMTPSSYLMRNSGYTWCFSKTTYMDGFRTLSTQLS